MTVVSRPPCQILVIGGGLAGISAALAGAESGASVTLASLGGPFSGSSFYPGTWGLGLIGPADGGDAADLEETILSVGCGMALPPLVHTLVSGILPSIEKLRRLGVALKQPESREKEYIPCFDHKHRSWNGIVFDSYRRVMEKQLAALQVALLPSAELMELCRDEQGGICGAVFYDGKGLVYQPSGATVLATGGFSGLFELHLTTGDVTGTGHAHLLRAGGKLINMEFMQIMPGYRRPAYQTIFNEKVFRFTSLTDQEGKPLLSHLPEEKALLALRSTHGPFTTRLPSRAVDEAIGRAGMVTACYTEELKSHPPAFARVYFDWLQEKKGLTMDDPVQLSLFSHASNGGILIDTTGFTGVPGLYACGEVTGGMHGADRIGGLSTANGLVFGTLAGQAAAEGIRSTRPPASWEIDGFAMAEPLTLCHSLARRMQTSCLVGREEKGLTALLTWLQEQAALPTTHTEDPHAIALTRRAQAQVETAQAVVWSALHRRESRGSHSRTDDSQIPQPTPTILTQEVLAP